MKKQRKKDRPLIRRWKKTHVNDPNKRPCSLLDRLLVASRGSRIQLYQRSRRSHVSGCGTILVFEWGWSGEEGGAWEGPE